MNFKTAPVPRASGGSIILGFYSYSEDPECEDGIFNRFNKYLRMKPVEWYSGPFSHIKMYFENTPGLKPPEAECVSISKNTENKYKQNGVEFRKVKVVRKGYAYLRLRLSITQMTKLRKAVSEIIKHETYMDKYLMLGLSSPRGKTTTETRYWFCSQLIGFLLIEAGVIETQVDPVKFSVTELYLRTWWKGEELLSNPFVKGEKSIDGHSLYEKFVGCAPDRLGYKDNETSSTQAIV